MALPQDGFVFTCFNSIKKITRTEFKIWMRLLKKVENSVLWIIKPHEAAMKNIFSEMKLNCVDKKRIIFAEPMGLNEHFSRHNCGDLFLDTFNFNGGATANIALSSGLPLITLLGKSFSARMAASLLSSCNMDELITHTHSEYEDLAYELATNKEKLSAIKKRLNNKTTNSFFNSNQFTDELERLYVKVLRN